MPRDSSVCWRHSAVNVTTATTGTPGMCLAASRSLASTRTTAAAAASSAPRNADFTVVAAPRSDNRLSITDIGRGVSLQLDRTAPCADVSWATYPADCDQARVPQLSRDDAGPRSRVRQRPAVSRRHEQLERPDGGRASRPRSSEPARRPPAAGANTASTRAKIWRRMRQPSRTGARSAVWSEKPVSAQRAAARTTPQSSAAGRHTSVSSLSSRPATNATSLSLLT